MNTAFGYDAENGKYLEATRVAHNYHTWILSQFTPYFGQRVLEVGAGVGLVTKMLTQSVTGELHSLEPSPVMYPQLQSMVKTLAGVTGTYSGTVQDNQTQLIKISPTSAVYINVLEHIEDDGQELRDVAAVLQPGGYICTFSPAMPWLYSKRDSRVGHYRRYTKSELIQKAEEAGLEVVEAYYFDFVGSLLWWVKFVLLRSDRISQGQVSLFDNVVVPIQRRLEPKWIPWGKNLVLVARKQRD